MDGVFVVWFLSGKSWADHSKSFANDQSGHYVYKAHASARPSHSDYPRVDDKYRLKANNYTASHILTPRDALGTPQSHGFLTL